MLKVFVVFITFYLLDPCRSDSEIHRTSLLNKIKVTETFTEDLNEDASMWRLWRPFRRWSEWRTITRRDSSLILSKILSQDERQEDFISLTQRGPSTVPLTSDSTVSVLARTKGSVQNELVTMLFESMIDCVVESWESITPKKQEDSNTLMDIGKTISELTFSSRKKKTIGKPSKTKRSRSKIELFDSTQIDGVPSSWWSGADEKAVIRFRNGNQYEGNLSMKCMHGEGRFQWADGTVYIGNFNDNEMTGKGLIQWKDDCWYQGDFAGNLRHGKGLYVDSRKQQSYTGEWHYGTKHGEGAIYYSKDFKNSYDGHWNHNHRDGYGSREYCALSGYKGEWDQNKREGKGLMIWPNHDFYRGEWKNGVMSGYGIYIWDAYYNNTMSLPSMTAYRGLWEKGQRNGYGVLDIGLGLGSHYKGNFKFNNKHGVGKFVTNNGFILQHKSLFTDDNLGSMANEDNENDCKRPLAEEPYKFDICDGSVGLLYHIEEALRNIDKQQEVRANLINDYIENNRALDGVPSLEIHRVQSSVQSSYHENFEDLIKFEESSLRKSLRCYETELKSIYYRYAKICNTEEIYFTPILIRLYLWQLYYDCKLHEKGLILVDIDNLFFQNPEWLARTAHGPFEKIYFWQFIHSLISVASKLYAKKELPTRKPDTILSSAFRTFMETDILPGSGRRRGRLVNGYGSIVPLKGSYELYRMLGEPHTVRKFICAVRPPPHYSENLKTKLVEPSEECLPRGRNVYIFGDEMSFVTDDNVLAEEFDYDYRDKLFNFANLPSKSIIKIFANIFPQLYENNKIMDLDIEITFFEFFEAFVACAEESNRIKDEEMRFKEKLSMANGTAPHQSVHGAKK